MRNQPAVSSAVRCFLYNIDYCGFVFVVVCFFFLKKSPKSTDFHVLLLVVCYIVISVGSLVKDQNTKQDMLLVMHLRSAPCPVMAGKSREYSWH